MLLFLALESLAAPFEDLRRFPPHHVAVLNCCFADEYVAHLEKELCVKHEETGVFVENTQYNTPLSKYSRERAHLIETLEIARRYRNCWKALVFSRSGECRMERLAQLRFLLGEANYAAGQMPVLPYWRMRSID